MSLSHADRAKRRAEIAKMVADAGPSERRELVAKLTLEYNLSGTIMRAILSQHSIEVPGSPAQYVKDSTLGVIAALQRGEPSKNVAEDFMISRQRVHQIRTSAMDAGIQFPSQEASP